MSRSEVKNILESVACLARDAYGSYIERQVDYIMKMHEESVSKIKATI